MYYNLTMEYIHISYADNNQPIKQVLRTNKLVELREILSDVVWHNMMFV